MPASPGSHLQPHVPDRTCLRIVAVALLVWIAIDLAALDACAFHGDHGRTSAGTTVSAPGSGGGPVPPHAALHSNHCFCHLISTGADPAPAFIAPAADGQAVPLAPPGRVLLMSSRLYHPPPLPA